jgi:RNA polymerase sigma factor (sigma-70 family)
MQIKTINFIFLFTNLANSFSLQIYLNYNQWSNIQKILQHKETPPNIRNTVKNIIYHAYEKLAIGEAYKFKKFHFYKCKNINIQDFLLSSKIGLYKSIQKYNGYTNFENYSKKYIHGELYKCLTNFHEITNIPKSYRRRAKTNLTVNSRKNYKKCLKTSLVSIEEYWRFDKMQTLKREKKIILTPEEEQEERNREQTIRAKMNELLQRADIDTFSKKVFEYKFDADFQIIRSNKHIAELMGCSEEHVRNKLENFKKSIINEIFSYNKKISLPFL